MPAKLHKKGENTKDTGGMLSHYHPYPIYKRYNLMSETETEINPERLRTHTLPEGIHEIGRIHILVLIVITVTFVVHRNAMVFRTAPTAFHTQGYGLPCHSRTEVEERHKAIVHFIVQQHDGSRRLETEISAHFQMMDRIHRDGRTYLHAVFKLVTAEIQIIVLVLFHFQPLSNGSSYPQPFPKPLPSPKSSSYANFSSTLEYFT